jgi:hypothetical protein
LIPLTLSFTLYFSVFSGSIANAVGRYVMIYLNKGEVEKSNVYFNSALIALFVLCGIALERYDLVKAGVLYKAAANTR